MARRAAPPLAKGVPLETPGPRGASVTAWPPGRIPLAPATCAALARLPRKPYAYRFRESLERGMAAAAVAAHNKLADSPAGGETTGRLAHHCGESVPSRTPGLDSPRIGAVASWSSSRWRFVSPGAAERLHTPHDQQHPDEHQDNTQLHGEQPPGDLPRASRVGSPHHATNVGTTSAGLESRRSVPRRECGAIRRPPRTGAASTSGRGVKSYSPPGYAQKDVGAPGNLRGAPPPRQSSLSQRSHAATGRDAASRSGSREPRGKRAARPSGGLLTADPATR
jgi:hypothetical protein